MWFLCIKSLWSCVWKAWSLLRTWIWWPLVRLINSFPSCKVVTFDILVTFVSMYRDVAGGAVIVKEAGGFVFDPWVIYFIPHEISQIMKYSMIWSFHCSIRGVKVSFSFRRKWRFLESKECVLNELQCVVLHIADPNCFRIETKSINGQIVRYVWCLIVFLLQIWFRIRPHSSTSSCYKCSSQGCIYQGLEWIRMRNMEWRYLRFFTCLLV